MPPTISPDRTSSIARSSNRRISRTVLYRRALTDKASLPLSDDRETVGPHQGLVFLVCPIATFHRHEHQQIDEPTASELLEHNQTPMRGHGRTHPPEDPARILVGPVMQDA